MLVGESGTAAGVGALASVTRPLVSVIVPVYDHADSLPRCVAALERQTLRKNGFEVLIIDNGCGLSGVAKLTARSCRVRVVAEPAPGSYAARNRGIAEARGDVIAFTDADCLPDPDWLEKGLEALLDSNADFAAGGIDVTVADPFRPTAVERFERAVSFRQENYVHRWGFGATANLFVRRHAFDSVGLFDSQLRSLGDREWGRRATTSGMRAVYADRARVKHAARRTFRGLALRCARVTGGFFSLATRSDRSMMSLSADALIGLPTTNSRMGSRDGVLIWGVGAFVVLVRVFELIRLAAGGPLRR